MDILSTTIMEILCILKITGFLSYVHVFICSCIISISNMIKKLCVATSAPFDGPY